MNVRACLAAAVVTLSAACRDVPAPHPADPTFAHDVAPIVYANCAVCHRPGQIAPFSLLTLEDVRTHAAQIVSAIESHEMPPWLPEPGVGHFLNARGLSQEQIGTIRAWVDGGMKEGRREDAPAPPSVDDSHWQLGKPDLIVTFQKAYTLQSGEGDVFRNFVVPVPLTRTVFVRGVEFRPGHPASIHHAVVGVDASGESRRLDAEDPEPGYAGMFSDEFHSPDGHFVGWTPGRTPTLEPDDMAWRLEAGTDLVVQMHMLPGAQPVALQPEIGLYLSDVAPSKVPFMVKLSATAIDIPAGASDYVVDDAYTLPVDVEAVSVYPHAHYLAREISASATLPTGEIRPLLSIRQWDFHWQEFYRYATPVGLPRGSTVSMRITYDNSAGHQPRAGETPRRVVYGPRSSDEMGDLWLQVLPRRREELGLLARDFVERRMQAQLMGAEQSVRASPDSPAAHNVLGTRYLAANRAADAIREFTIALRLQPRYPEASNNLGAALVSAGRSRDALPHLRTAVQVRPADYRVHFNLGNALRDSGRPDEAAREFERALVLNPDSADILNNLAVLDGARGDYANAIARLERALSLREGYPDAHHNLALALAAVGRRSEAITHARRAVDLRPDFEDARRTLAELERH